MSSLTLVFEKAYGLESMFLIMGGIGSVIAVCFMIFVREPTRGKYHEPFTSKDMVQSDKKPTPKEALIYIMTNECTRWIFIGAGFRQFGGYALANYMPSYFI